MLDSRGVIGQYWGNRLFVQAFPRGHGRVVIIGKSSLTSRAYVLCWVRKTPESNMSLSTEDKVHARPPTSGGVHCNYIVVANFW
jgi:hypothetical protein